MKCTNEEWLWTVNDAKNECKISFTQVQVDMHDWVNPKLLQVQTNHWKW